MEPSDESSVRLTDSALRRAQSMLSARPGFFLRIAVDSGGCSGFQYQFQTDDQHDPEDHVFEQNGVQWAIDAASWPLLKGSVVDFQETMAASHFVVDNPQAQLGCGCGHSFSI